MGVAAPGALVEACVTWFSFLHENLFRDGFRVSSDTKAEMKRFLVFASLTGPIVEETKQNMTEEEEAL